MARQTFVTYLQQATDQKIVNRKEVGKTTFYSLNISPHEENTFHSMLDFIKTKLSFIPDEIKGSLTNPAVTNVKKLDGLDTSKESNGIENDPRA